MSTTTQTKNSTRRRPPTMSPTPSPTPAQLTPAMSSMPFDVTSPTPEEIAAHAYLLFLARGEAHGQDLDDWLEAERQLIEARRLSRSSDLPVDRR